MRRPPCGPRLSARPEPARPIRRRPAPLLAVAALATWLAVAKGIDLARAVALADTGIRAEDLGPLIASAQAETAPNGRASGAQRRRGETAPIAVATTGPAGVAATAQPTRPALPRPADVASCSALADVAADLKAREEALSRRASELAVREAALNALKPRLDGQLGELERYKAELEKLLGLVSARDEAELAQLAKVYETMKAKQAAAVFDGLEREILLALARRMRDTKLAAILALMEPARARQVTMALAVETGPPGRRP